MPESLPPDRDAGSSASASPPSAELVLLGGARLSGPPALGSQPLAVGKPLALLAFLACSPGRSASRDQLIDLLWADVDRDAARHTLRQTVWYIKRRLGLDPFIARGDALTLERWVATDRDAFLSALDAARYADAVAAYAGDFFPGFAAPGGAEFEQWADLERSRLQSLYVRASDAHARELLTAGRPRDAVQVARRARDLAPSAQATWRLLLEMLLAADDRISALVEVDQLELWLAREEVTPDKATLATIRLVRSESGRDRELAPDGLVAELIGREREFAELIKGQENARRGAAVHVHVWARPGFGKTRLLQGFARRLRAARGRLVSVRALQANRDIPYSLAAELTLALARLRGAAGISPEAAGALVALAPGVSAHLSAPPDRSTGDEALRRRTLALQELIATIADDAPIAILVDDLHWADPGSRGMLASVAAGLGEQHVLLVTTSRQPERLASDGARSTQLNLAPLTDDQVGALVTSLGELPAAPWTETFAARLTASSDGSPLLVLETLQLAIENGALSLADRRWSCPDPEALERTLDGGSAIRQRLLAVSETHQATLLLLAVLGSDLSAVEAQRVLGDEGAGALLELESRGLLTHRDGRWAIAHDEIAELACEMAAPARLARAHRQAAVVLEASGIETPTMLLRAARHRRDAGDTREVQLLFARLVRLTQAGGDRNALLALAADVLGAGSERAERQALVRALPWRLRTSTARAVRSATLGAVGLVAVAVTLQGRMVRAPEPDAVAMVPFISGSDTSLLRVPVASGAWRGDRVIDAARTRLAPEAVRSLLRLSGVYASWSDTVVGGSLAYGTGAGIELVQVDLRSGRTERLTDAPGDDTDFVRSPDGRFAVYATARFDPDSQRTDLVLLDRRTKQERALTRTNAWEQYPRWSPDGSRIAYRTRYATPTRSTLCWTTVDGAHAECHVPDAEIDMVRLLGWDDDVHVLVHAEARDADRPMLARIDVRSGRTRILEPDWEPPTSATWPLQNIRFGLSRASGADGEGLRVYDLDRGSASVAVRLPVRGQFAAGALMFWQEPATTRQMLDRIRIEGAPAAVGPGSRVQLRVAGRTAAGTERTVPYQSWHLLDSALATITASGVLRPRAVGTVHVVASAGGWRTDTMALAIVNDLRSTTALREAWVTLDTTAWRLYGTPRPARAPDGLGGRALHVNGDYSLFSGAIHRRAIPALEGVGLEARVRLPVNTSQWQALSVSLEALADDEALAATTAQEAREFPNTWKATAMARACELRAPRGEGGDAVGQIQFRIGEASDPVKQVEPVLTDGAWHAVRLQLFADGRCGLAIDGRVITVSDAAIRLDQPLRVHISGQSVGTRVLVGALEAWRGERHDLPWFPEDTVRATAP